MNGTPRIVPLGPDHSADDGILELDQAIEEDGGGLQHEPNAEYVAESEWDEPARPSRAGYIAPALAAVTVAAWTGFFAFAHWSAMRNGAAPAQWAEWLVAWSVPVLLVLTVLLVGLRTSRREALRFADAARALSEESERLETRLVTVNGELSLAREFVAAQSRDLEALGRIAAERLSHNADRLAGLIHTNTAQIESIASVSASALENMDKLRSQLPVIANSAKDVTNNIGNAGRAAHTQLQDMVAGFNRLNEFGQASERQVGTMRTAVGEAVDEFARQAELLGEIAAARFTALADEGKTFRQRLDGHEIAALAAVRGRAAALTEELALARAEAERWEGEAVDALRLRLAGLREEGAAVSLAMREGGDGAISAWRDHVAALTAETRATWTELARLDGEATAAATARLGELSASADALHVSIAARSEELSGEIVNRRAELEIAGRSAIESLRLRLAEIDAAIQAQRERHIAQSREVAAQAATIGERLEDFSATMTSLGAHGEEVAGKLERGLFLLTDKLGTSKEALSGADAAIAELTEGSVRLLELIQASTEHTRVHLPQALAGTEGRLQGIEDKVIILRDALGEAGVSGQALSDYVVAARSGLGDAAGEMATLHSGLEHKTREHRAALAAIREEIAEARRDSEALGEHVQHALQAAIDKLAAAARDTAETLGAQSEEALDALAKRLGEKSAAAIDRAMAGQAELAIGQLEAAVAGAASASRDAAIQMRDQLAKVDELAGNLERRVSHARARAEEQVDNDFARRVALITESLNSAAIDIAKALSTDVTDTAWAAYLRGDRGIFTRRAVTLLDGIEARNVAQHYEADRDFRENVNHYIHDFEAMLRNLLSTRDGNALGVTLLSSDMGKLYVALAQGIERLRA